MNIKELAELKEMALEVDKLIRFSLEMRSITRYKGGEKVNIHKLSAWSYKTKYREE